MKTLLDDKNNSLNAYTDKNLTYLFSPCEDLKWSGGFEINGTNECKDGFSLCVYDSLNKNATLLGTQKDVGFLEDNKQKMSMTFKKGKDK